MIDKDKLTPEFSYIMERDTKKINRGIYLLWFLCAVALAFTAYIEYLNLKGI